MTARQRDSEAGATPRPWLDLGAIDFPHPLGQSPRAPGSQSGAGSLPPAGRLPPRNCTLMAGPLKHIRVLDLSRVLAGPWATQILADLGAEVIKIERPGRGDDTRERGPPFLKDREGRDTRDSAYFLGCNRGKKSVTLDLAKREGQEIVRTLAKQCDVLVENFKVG